MNNYLEKRRFRNIDIDDRFFDSLKSDYKEFEEWFKRKENEEAYLISDNKLIQGFLYIKYEVGPITDVEPIINCDRALKIGTLKINPHGTRLGERFIKKALDYALTWNAEVCYVTIFEKHTALIELLKKYGFTRNAIKHSTNGTELVYVKNLKVLKKDILLDYPLINRHGSNKFLLSIYPRYHTNMFPDSILNNESIDILEDVSHTNSIHKVYVCSMDVSQANRGDIIVMYRTKTEGQNAEYTSVVTSICVVEEIKKQDEFINFEDFFAYANTYSIFEREDLRYWFNKGKCYAIKMTYNAALSKRLIRKKLIEEIGIERNVYWGFLRLTDDQFDQILEEGVVSEGIIID